MISVIRVICGLWFVGFDKFGLYRKQSAEEPVVLVVRSGGEEEPVVWAGIGFAASEPQCPKTLDTYISVVAGVMPMLFA